MKRIAWKFAASTAVLAATMVSGLVGSVGAAPASAQAQPRGQNSAAELFQRAGQAIKENKFAEAIALLEQAVMISPRDAGYRLLLADSYMKSGRFRSAEATYRDVLTLDPNQSRAALTMALMQVANGRQQDAMAQLESLEGSAAPVDLGLAYALAGAPQRAIDLLEPAARAMGATPRVRQNLALAYAFGGDWQRAKTIAAQDVEPSELANRMAQWAALASTSGPPEHVAAVLGVSPAHDVGQPVRLALNARPPALFAAPAPVAVASAAPVLVPQPVPQAVASASVEQPRDVEVIPMPTPKPVRVAFAAAAPAPVIAPAAAARPVAAQIAVPVPATQALAASVAAVPAPRPEVSAPPPIAWAEARPVDAPAPVEAPAFARAPAPVEAPAFAEAPAPVEAPVFAEAPAPVEAPAVEYAELEAPEWGVDQSGAVNLPKEEPVAERVPVRVQYAAAAQSLVRPDPVVMPVASRAARSLAPIASRALRAVPLPGTRSAEGKFVVQIGAFSSAANAARAWETYEKQFGLRAEQPVTMTIDHEGRLLHRVAISGFVKRGEATQVCNVLRSRGGECFVRSNAGDAAIDWAARYSRRA